MLGEGCNASRERTINSSIKEKAGRDVTASYGAIYPSFLRFCHEFGLKPCNYPAAGQILETTLTFI